MNTWQWVSLAFTCGIFVGQYVPRLINWLIDRYEKKIHKEYEEYEKRKESEDTE